MKAIIISFVIATFFNLSQGTICRFCKTGDTDGLCKDESDIGDPIELENVSCVKFHKHIPNAAGEIFSN